MDQVIQIQWSAASSEEARQVCRALIEKKMVACAQILPQVESIYSWKGNIETAFEVKVYLKTLESRFSDVEAFIVENSSYEVPEILTWKVEGFIEYLDWVKLSV